MGAHRLHRPLFLVALLAGLAGLAGGCGDGPAVDYCDVRCKCANCADDDREACLIANNAEFDRADLYDCGQEASDLYDCWVRLNTCDDFNHAEGSAKCQKSLDEYGKCIAATSSLQ